MKSNPKKSNQISLTLDCSLNTVFYNSTKSKCLSFHSPVLLRSTVSSVIISCAETSLSVGNHV